MTLRSTIDFSCLQPQQKRIVDDLERRINPLFDALNCETLSKPVCEQLLVLSQGMSVTVPGA